MSTPTTRACPRCRGTGLIELAPKPAPKVRPRRNTDPSARTTAALHARAGDRCERCGDTRDLQRQHRRPRGMGGSRRIDTNALSNLLLLCAQCHHEVEVINRSQALAQGFLVRQGHDPAIEPVLLLPNTVDYRWVLLTDDGQYLDQEGTP